MQPSQKGDLKRVRTEPNILGFLRLPVTLARILAPIGLMLSLAGALALGMPLLQITRRDEALQIKLKYGMLLVDVASIRCRDDDRVLEVATIDALARIAEKHSSMILHEFSGGTHYYVVHDGNDVYSYRITGSSHSTSPTTKQASTASKESAVLPVPSHQQNRITPTQPATTSLSAEGMAENWHAVFLSELRRTGLTSEACRTAGISMATAYHERERYPAFAQAWNEARTNGSHFHNPKTL